MKKLLLFVFIGLSFAANAAFDDYFESKSLRIDYFHTGDNTRDFYSIDELMQEPIWAGSKVNLIDPFNLGNYKFMVFDDSSNTLIYSRTYSTLFSEWQTTEEAKKTVKSFSETVICPFPKKNVRIEFYTRNKKGVFEKKFEYLINPKSYLISRERKMEHPIFTLLKSGDPNVKIDVVIIPEGYTAAEMPKFKTDCQKLVSSFFSCNPYKDNKDKFNMYGVEAPSEESGTDNPGKNLWKKTVLNSSFYTFNVERYLMTNDNKTIRSIAANAPYDQIYILVNTKTYGGGAIYNYYSLCVTDHYLGEYIFTHEFSHAFAGLGDEYSDAGATYQDLYPAGVEPWEPNLTTLVDFDKKWKNMVEATTPIPTPDEPKYYQKTGAFEGAGYVAKGVYRPAYDCIMRTINFKKYCKVCTSNIQKMIDFYTK